MNAAQKTICRVIETMLNDETFRKNFRETGFDYIFRQTIRQYAEINSKYKKTWNNIGLCIEHHEFSINAYKKIKDYIKEKKGKEFDKHEELISFLQKRGSIDKKELMKKLHYEHIVPISVFVEEFSELMNSDNKVEFDKICEIMKKNVVIILTEDEKKKLDNKKESKTSGNRNDRLELLNAVIHENTTKNTLG